MTVDINQSIDYVLETINPPEQGCKIEIQLYQPLKDYDIYNTVREVSRYVKYVSIPVVLNGAVVSVKPESEKDWGEESNDDAFVKLTSTGARLAIYNRGVLVCDEPKYRFGVAGTIVSKRRLEVNFARNEVLSSCPVWTAIRAVLEKSAKKITVKKVLNADERLNLIGKICAGEVDVSEIQKAQIFVDVSGHAWSLDSIRTAAFPAWTYAESGSVYGDRLIQGRLALVLEEELVKAFDCPANCLFTQVWKCPDGTTPFSQFVHKMPYKSFEKLSKSVSGAKNAIVPVKEYRKSENLWLGVLNAGLCFYEGRECRKLVIGESVHSNAWTDGSSFIAVSRSLLEKNPLCQRFGVGFKDGKPAYETRPKLESIVRVITTMLHEICHDTDSEETMRHSPDFHAEFHARVFGEHRTERYGQECHLDLAMLVAKAFSYASCQAKRNNEMYAEGAVVVEKPVQTQAPVPVPQPQPETVVLAALEAKPETPTLKEIANGLAERTYEQVADEVFKARAGGMTFRDIEKKFGLKQRHGNNARRICLKQEKRQ